MTRELRRKLFFLALAIFVNLILLRRADTIADSATDPAGNESKYAEKNAEEGSRDLGDQDYRYDEPALEIRLPSTYEATKENNHFKAVKSTEGIIISIDFMPLDTNSGLAKYNTDRKHIQDAYKQGNPIKAKENIVDHVPGMFTLERDKGDPKGTHTAMWKGYDTRNHHYIVIKAYFPSQKKYETNFAEFERILTTISWNLHPM